jgi:hypothetical protein
MVPQDLFRAAPQETLQTTGSNPPPQRGKHSEAFLFVLLNASAVHGGFSHEFPPADHDVKKSLHRASKHCTVTYVRTNKVRAVLRL